MLCVAHLIKCQWVEVCRKYDWHAKQGQTGCTVFQTIIADSCIHVGCCTECDNELKYGMSFRVCCVASETQA